VRRQPERQIPVVLPDSIGVLCGIHDSSANFYRYQQAGLADFALISTGTWIVGLADIPRPDEFTVTEQRICNADVSGNPVAGVLVMGGREFSVLSGDAPDTPVDVFRAHELLRQCDVRQAFGVEPQTFRLRCR